MICYSCKKNIKKQDCGVQDTVYNEETKRTTTFGLHTDCLEEEQRRWHNFIFEIEDALPTFVRG